MDNFPVVVKHNFDGRQEQAVYVRELYEKLGLDAGHYKRWCKLNLEEVYENGLDWVFRHEGEKSTGRPTRDYIVTLDTAKHLAMVARTEAGKAIRQYFIESEKKLREGSLQAPITMGEETSKLFNTLLDGIGQYSSTAKVTVAAALLERAWGVKVPYTALPPVTEKRYSATEIGQMIGLSNKMVGMLTKKMNLRNPPNAEARLSVAKFTNKEVSMLYYSEGVVQKIKEYLNVA